MNSKEFVSLLATVINILLFFCGMNVVYSILLRKSIKELSVLPYASCLVCCLLWTKYGLLTDDKTVIFVNLLGSVIEAFYTGVFYIYSKDKVKVLKKLFPLFFFLFSSLAYTKYIASHRPDTVFEHGTICSIYNIFNYAAPLSASVSVFKSKSTENLSFSLSFLYFLCAVFWYLYGFLKKDFFITIPNFCGIVFGTLQLCLFIIYPRKRLPSVQKSEAPNVLIS